MVELPIIIDAAGNTPDPLSRPLVGAWLGDVGLVGRRMLDGIRRQLGRPGRAPAADSNTLCVSRE